ncbi:MAG: stress response translation initiation inhibitor YciH [Candidatus Njordarchaeum guaymaensis]
MGKKKEIAPLPFDFETQIALMSQKVKIFLETRKKRHVVTVVVGLDDKSIDLRQLSKDLKRFCATGGTFKNDKKFGPIILLQGDHVDKVREFLVNNLGIPSENVEIL